MRSPASSARAAAPASLRRSKRDGHEPLLVRHRPQLERRLHDDAERAVRADEELGQVVAGHVLHDLAAAAHERAVGGDDRESDEEIAHGAVEMAPRAGGVGRDHAAERRRARRRADRARATDRAPRSAVWRSATVIPASAVTVRSPGSCSRRRSSRRRPSTMPGPRRAAGRRRRRCRRPTASRGTPASAATRTTAAHLRRRAREHGRVGRAAFDDEGGQLDSRSGRGRRRRRRGACRGELANRRRAARAQKRWARPCSSIGCGR